MAAKRIWQVRSAVATSATLIHGNASPGSWVITRISIGPADVATTAGPASTVGAANSRSASVPRMVASRRNRPGSVDTLTTHAIDCWSVARMSFAGNGSGVERNWWTWSMRAPGATRSTTAEWIWLSTVIDGDLIRRPQQRARHFLVGKPLSRQVAADGPADSVASRYLVRVRTLVPGNSEWCEGVRLERSTAIHAALVRRWRPASAT